MATDLSGRWESYRVFSAPVNWRFRSGDRFEFNANPTGERLVAPFEVARGVIIPPGSYQWRRYRLEVGTAQKRRLSTQVTWWFGGFYNGDLDQVVWNGAWNPTALFTVEFSGERDIGRLANGRFTQTLIGTRLRVNMSPDLSVASYVQYDTDTNSVGTNAAPLDVPAGRGSLHRLQPQRPLAPRSLGDSNQFVVKLQYAWRL